MHVSAQIQKPRVMQENLNYGPQELINKHHTSFFLTVVYWLAISVSNKWIGHTGKSTLCCFTCTGS